MAEQIKLDGSQGEGGGQILRSSLALAAVCNRPIEITKIRARRAKPGLARQHLACVLAAAEVVDADVEGAELRSKRLRFTPKRPPKAGKYKFDIGTAGSTGLVFQTVVWPLLMAEGRSTVTISGGTHNPMSPPFDFLERTFLPVLRGAGAKISLQIERHGFYPAGGGRIHAVIDGPTQLGHLSLLERGEVRSVRGRVVIANLPSHIGDREAKELRRVLDIESDAVSVESVASQGPGNAIHVEIETDSVTEVISGFGDKGVPAERVARDAGREANTYLASGAPVGEHLADQLVIPMALAGGGEIRCTTPSLHARTNIDVVSRFIDIDFDLEAERDNAASYRMRANARTA